MRGLAYVLLVAGLASCRVLSSGLASPGAASPHPDATTGPEASEVPGGDDARTFRDAGEPPGVAGAPIVVGCSDGTREGFRDVTNWPNIAGCAGAFDQPGVLGAPDLAPACNLEAGDTSTNPKGAGCNAADLCAQHWHLCRDGADVTRSSPTGDCESCVPAGEPRFFLVATGASPIGMCSPDNLAANDLHGCGGLGQPESDTCAPLARRMGFADCLATHGVWSCGSDADSLREATLVTKSEITMGGALCCKD